MLVLRGQSHDAIRRMPLRIRRAAHWALYAEAIVGPEGFPATTAPKGSSPDVRMQYGRLAAQVAKQRAQLFPEGDE